MYVKYLGMYVRMYRKYVQCHLVNIQPLKRLNRLICHKCGVDLLTLLVSEDMRTYIQAASRNLF